jgi:hypothetical protein
MGQLVLDCCEQGNALIQAVGGCSGQVVGKQNASRRPVVQSLAYDFGRLV